jgi:hypothetical protein
MLTERRLHFFIALIRLYNLSNTANSHLCRETKQVA